MRERTQANLQTSGSKRNAIKNDLRSSGTDELRHKYGKLKSSYKEHDIMEEGIDNEPSDEETSKTGYESPTLKRKFQIKTSNKTIADEE